MKDLYTDLLKIVEPYLSDFTGYDEKEQAFNIVLAVKELLLEFSIENERLYEENKKLEDFIKSDGEIDHINHEYTYKLRTCLQEIKAIAESPKPFKDFSEIKTATEVEYDYAAICNELELRLHKVLEKITKAESEG